MNLYERVKEALQYKPKGRRNIGRPRKRWRDQFHFEHQGTGNTPNPSWTWWWWWVLFLSEEQEEEDGDKILRRLERHLDCSGVCHGSWFA